MLQIGLDGKKGHITKAQRHEAAQRNMLSWCPWRLRAFVVNGLVQSRPRQDLKLLNWGRYARFCSSILSTIWRISASESTAADSGSFATAW